MSDETKPILLDSGIYAKSSGSRGHFGQLHQQAQHQQAQQQQQQQQHLIIQPVEFDYRHRNAYGYLALGAFVLVLINYIMLKERSCQYSLVNGYQNYDLIQGFHMTTLIVAIIVFVLSYFNFALVIQDFKLLFYTSALIIFACSIFLIYSAISITTTPCVSTNFNNASEFISLFDTSVLSPNATNVFAARDGIGITVFVFDIIAGLLMFAAGRRFYQKC